MRAATPAARLGRLAVAVGVCLTVSPSRPLGLLLWTVLVAASVLSRREAWARAARMARLAGPLALLSLGLLAWQRWPGPSALFLGQLWLRAALVAGCTVVAAAGLSENELLEGLLGLPLPRRVSTLLYLMLRGLRQVGGMVRATLAARDLRGRPRGVRAVRVAAAISGALLLRLGQRAEWQALGLVSRGFDGSLRLLSVRRLTAVDGLELVALALAGGLLAWL